MVTPKIFTKFVVYSDACGGDFTAVSNPQHFYFPINRRDFLNDTSCEWNISTKWIDEVVRLAIFVYDIEEENDLGVLLTRSANISDGSNLTTIMIQVNRCTQFLQITLVKKFESFLFLKNNVKFCCFCLPIKYRAFVAITILYCINKIL